MATQLANLSLELAHFNHFKQYIRVLEGSCAFTLERLLQAGLVSVSTAFECALADLGGHTVIGTDAADLSDGSDAKLSTVRHTKRGRDYRAPIGGIAGKTGLLRVQVYERIHQKFYYFKIPYQAYCAIPRSSNIEIPFNLDGTPRRDSKGVRKYDNWWIYEVPSFQDLAA